MTAPHRTDFNHCSCLVLRQASRHVTQLFDQSLAEAGLRVTQFSILVSLERGGPRSINELAAELVMDRTTLGRNLRPLERDGLVAIAVDPRDRRSRALTLTAAGAARVAAATRCWALAQSRFEERYGLDETKALHGMLRRVANTDLTEPG